jgi:hypothetical protein
VFQPVQAFYQSLAFRIQAGNFLAQAIERNLFVHMLATPIG